MRLDRKTTSLSLLVVVDVRADGQKVLLAIKSMSGESTEAWRAVLDDLMRRGPRRPEFRIVDGAPVFEAAIAAVWDGVPVQRCTVYKHRNLLAHAAERLHQEITADQNGRGDARGDRGAAQGLHSQIAAQASCGGRQPAGSRRPALHLHATAAQSVEERTTANAIERLHEEFKRRMKTQTVLPSVDIAAMLFWALLASDQINMRKVARPQSPSISQ
nr:transposase [Bradyrhizobium australiense]